MTEKQLRTKMGLLHTKMVSNFWRLFESALKSGALNLDAYKDTFELPKVLTEAIMLNQTDEWGALTKEGKTDVKNLRKFI